MVFSFRQNVTLPLPLSFLSQELVEMVKAKKAAQEVAGKSKKWQEPQRIVVVLFYHYCVGLYFIIKMKGGKTTLISVQFFFFRGGLFTISSRTFHCGSGCSPAAVQLDLRKKFIPSWVVQIELCIFFFCKWYQFSVTYQLLQWLEPCCRYI